MSVSTPLLRVGMPHCWGVRPKQALTLGSQPPSVAPCFQFVTITLRDAHRMSSIC